MYSSFDKGIREEVIRDWEIGEEVIRDWEIGEEVIEVGPDFPANWLSGSSVTASPVPNLYFFSWPLTRLRYSWTTP